MKKVIALSILFVLTVFAFLPTTAFANSAPIRSSPETFELYSVYDEDISVTKEKLIFDFTDSDIVRVTARYDFTDSGNAKALTLAFPFVADWRNTFWGETELEEPQILVNGNNVSISYLFSHNLGESSLSAMTIEEILDSVNKSNTPLSAKLTRYEVEGDGQITLPESYGRIIYENLEYLGSSRYAVRDSGRKSVIYAAEKADLHSSTLDVTDAREIDAEDMITELAQIYNAPKSLFRVNYNFLKDYRRLDAYDLLGRYNEMLVLMQFDMPFVCGSNELQVSYTMYSTRLSGYSPTVYSHEYLSNPAKNWAHFGTFECEIITSMHLIESSVGCEFDKTETGYRFVRQGLPEENISIRLCEKRLPVQFGTVLIAAAIILTVALVGGASVAFSALATLAAWLIIRKQPRVENTKRKYKAVLIGKGDVKDDCSK